MNIKYLEEQYTPREIPFREEQIKELESTYDFLERYGVGGGNRLLQGPSGSGKSLVLKHLKEKYWDRTLFASGIDHPNTTSILRRLAKSTYKNTEQLSDFLINQLETNKKVIIIDEISKVKDRKELLAFLNRMYRHTSCPVIICTNQWNFIHQMEQDIRLTLLFKRMEFDRYDAMQLKRILDDRLKLVQEDISEETKNYLCAKSVEEGSARLVLNLATQCLLERDHSIKFINRKIIEEEQKGLIEFIRRLSQKEKRVVDLIFSHQKIDFAQLIKLSGISKKKALEVLDLLENDYLLIESARSNLGRGKGKRRIIQLTDMTLSPYFDEIIQEEKKYRMQEEGITNG